ncbi:MAG: dockerin type I repeat-containing protein [candidate division Zixibacteria bacterium]|jgi:hypothetical protein|nr:dockerin type I repeat-containing protein [candidate division Zixibacteria bacterium]
MLKWYHSAFLFMAIVLLIGLPVIPEQSQPTPPTSSGTPPSAQPDRGEKEFYFKAGYPDYCPSGTPDFSQVQDFSQPPDGSVDAGYCGPVALANCLWWFDSKFEPLPVVPPGISDNYPLVTPYAQWDDHDPLNVQPLVAAMATTLNTNLLAPGTNIVDFDAGVRDWLASRGLLDDYDVNLYSCGAFTWDFLAGEVRRSQDVILLIGFYLAPGGNPQECCRLGGHYVTVAGVDSVEALIAVSDPYLDLASPPPPSHNDAAVVSHDIYSIAVMDPTLCETVAGCLFLPDYPADPFAYEFVDQNGGTTCPPGIPGPIFAVIEYAEIICPRETPDTWYWKPDTTYALTGMPDFPSQLPCHSGPTAVTNCLWWYGAMGYYPFVNAIELKDELFTYFHSDTVFDPWGGTDVHVMEDGLTRFFWDPDPKWQFYETTYRMPDFFVMAESLMVCQDIILLIGNWWFDGEQWWRDGGRYVTMAGVDMTTMMVAVSDPETDNAEAGGAGRVRPPSHAGIVHDPRDPTHWYPVTPGSYDYPVSHDAYPVMLDSPSPGGTWWLPGFPRGFSPTGANCPAEFQSVTLANPDPTMYPYHAEVEYAVMICPGEPQAPEEPCEYYKPPYLDYAPQGMPDFDQKQAMWQDEFGVWSHDGPAAVANCLWWFDSRFEPSPIDPRPFFPGPGNPPPNDNYPLVQAFGPFDDHDTTNVIPFINDLAMRMGTNVHGSGTPPNYLVDAVRQIFVERGLDPYFKDTLVPLPTYEFIRDQVLDCQDVILLLAFYEETAAIPMPIGWHWVTVAGVCTTKTQICISDPFLDALEGEPPVGSAHGGGVHNDANNISGPHGQIQHDPYMLTSMMLPGFLVPVEVVNYPTPPELVTNFLGMNAWEDWAPYDGGPVITIISQAFVICPTEPQQDTCEYYKAPYEDYAPFGMPDFDQKQNAWTGGPLGGWSFCGPVALANCFWWFDSKFEPTPVVPPTINDNYPLVTPYGPWDDHDPSNVIPFVDSLARYTNCPPGGIGTFILDLFTGLQAWLSSVGLAGDYTSVLVPAPPFELIRDEVMRSQDVILLLGFYEFEPTGSGCVRHGGHYVTVAGVCPEEFRICISDPYFDANEGEPPAGSAHGSAVHNDAALISGPHGQIQHDAYNLAVQQVCPQYPPIVELIDYPDLWTDVVNFFQLNPAEWSGPPIPYAGGEIRTLIDYAVIICPLDTCAGQYPGDVDNNGVIDSDDIDYLASFIDSGGPAPTVPANADPDGDCDIDYTDIAFLDSYINGTGSAPVQCTCVNPPVTCCRDETGNINDSGAAIDLSDLIYLVNYLFLGGPAPWCPEEANINGDLAGAVDLSDLIALVNYLFLGGVPPAHCL